MANILGVVTVDSVLIISTDIDPRLGGGTDAPMGSYIIAADGSGTFYKTGAGLTDYTYTSARSRNNTVVVNALSDLPAPVAGVITLVNNTNYSISGTIALGVNKIQFGVSNTIYGEDKSTDKLVYTGASTMFNGVNQDFTIRNLTIACPVAGASAFSVSGALTNNLEIREVIFGQCKSLGTITGFGVIVFQKNFITLSDNGITFSGASEDVIVIDNIFKSNNNTAGCKWLNFTAASTFTEIIIGRNSITCASNETGITVGAITISGYGKLFDTTFLGAGTYLSGINYQSAGWEMTNNSNISDATANGQIGFVSNATTTSVNSTYIAINGTYLLNANPNKFNMPSNGVIRYTDKQPAQVRIVVLGSAFAASAYAADVAIFKNGVLQAVSQNGFTLYTSRELLGLTYIDPTAVLNDTYEVRIKKTTAGAVVTTVQNIQIAATVI